MTNRRAPLQGLLPAGNRDGQGDGCDQGGQAHGVPRGHEALGQGAAIGGRLRLKVGIYFAVLINRHVVYNNKNNFISDKP